MNPTIEDLQAELNALCEKKAQLQTRIDAIHAGMADMRRREIEALRAKLATNKKAKATA